MGCKIKQAAQLAGISEHTLRYYEKMGLLHVPRDENGVRQYGEMDIFWLQLIKCLRETGMTIADLKEMADLSAQGNATVNQRREILKRHKKKIEAQIAELENCVKTIDWKLDWYGTTEQTK